VNSLLKLSTLSFDLDLFFVAETLPQIFRGKIHFHTMSEKKFKENNKLMRY